MGDFIWGLGTRLVNILQANRLIPDSIRTFFRRVGHIVIAAPPQRTIVTRTGEIYLTPPRHKGSRSYVNGTYEEALCKFVLEGVRDGDTFVDVGSFIGYYAIMVSKRVGGDGSVYAVEPEPRALDYLNKNIALNNCKNVSVINAVASDKAGFVNFESAEVSGVGSAGGFVVGSGEGAEIRTIPLDELGLNNVGWIKLDTDGHETQALSGLKNTIAQSPNVKLILEIDPSHFNSAHNSSSIIQTLEELGFTYCIVCEENYRFCTLGELSSVQGHRNVVLFK